MFDAKKCDWLIKKLGYIWVVDVGASAKLNFVVLQQTQIKISKFFEN